MQKIRMERVAAVVVPVILLAALIVACIWGNTQSARADTLEENVKTTYRRSFYELSDNVTDLCTALKKLQVSAGKNQHILLLSDVWRLSGAAVENLSSLPQSHIDTVKINRLIVQTGDYARALTSKVLSGSVIGQTDYDQLYALYEAMAGIRQELTTRISTDDFPVETVTGDGYYETTGGSEDDASIANYPTLIYDGPFSDNTEKAAPRGLPDGEVTQQEAMELAGDYLGGATLAPAGEENGSIPAYAFSGTDSAGRELEIAVTKQGGQILWMMAETTGGAEGVPDESVTESYRQAAKAYLDARGYQNMQATYAQYYAGIALLNFAASQNDVLLYPDLVKVYVERDSGAVVGVDAQNYLFSHTERTLPENTLTVDEARNAVSDQLQIASEALALIPKNVTAEVLCYEFKGTCRGASWIVYINAQTGEEEEIFEIINSEEGQLVV